MSTFLGLLPELIQNLALLLALVFLYGLSWPSLRRTPPALRTLVTGTVFGGIAVVGMLMPVEVVSGVRIDQRGVIIALAGVFHGPGPALVAAVIAGGARLGLGGLGAPAGLGMILTAAAIGVLVHRRRGARATELGVGQFLLLGGVLTAAAFTWVLAVPGQEPAWQLLERLALPLAVSYPLATALLGVLLSYLHGERRRLIRTEASIEHAREAMFWTDATGLIVDANTAATTLSGYSRDELRGMHVSGLHDDCSATRWPAIWREAREQRLLRVESEIRTKEGRRVPVDLSCAFVELEADAYLAHCLRDVSERRRAETETEALAAVGRQLASTLDLAEAANRVVSTLLGFFRARRSFLYRIDTTSAGLVCVAAATDGEGESWVGRRAPKGVGVAGRAVAEGRVVWSPDLLTDPRIVLADWSRPSIEREGNSSVIAAPVIAQGEIIGALGVADEAGRVFSEQDCRMLSAFADKAAMALRNADLFDETTRRRREAEGLARVARSLSESLDVTQIAERIVAVVPSLLDARGVVLRRVAPDGSLVMLAAAGPAARFFELGHALPAGTGVAGRAVAEGRPVWSRDALDDPGLSLDDNARQRLAAAGVRAHLAAPLRAAGKVVGALVIADAVVRDFSPAEVVVLEAFADQAALALENARVHEEADRRRRQAEVLSEIARSINASLDLGIILQRVVEGAKELCAADAAAISIRDAATGDMVYRWWTEPRPPGYGTSRVVPGKGAGGTVLLSGLPFRTDDYLRDPRIDQSYADAVRAAGAVAMLVVPIRIEGAIEALLYVDNLSPRPFSDRDETILAQLADHAGAAIGNARLYAKATDRAARLRTLSTLTQTITSAQVGAQVFDAIAAAASTLLGAKAAYVWVADFEAQILRSVGRFGVDPAIERRLVDVPIIPFGVGIPGQIFQSRTPEYVRDRQGDPRGLNPRLVHGLGLHAYAGLPLIHGDRALGVLSVFFGDTREFTGEEKELMLLLAAHAAIAIRNAQAYGEEQAAHAAVRAAEERYRALFERTPIGLFRVAPDGRILDLNLAAIQALGLPDLETALGVSGDPFALNLEGPRHKDAAQHEDEVLDFETRQRRWNGSMGWFRINSRAVRGADGRVVCHEGSLEDITDRREAEETMRRYTERLDMLHELDWAILATQSPAAIAEAALRGLARLIRFQHGRVAVSHAHRDETTVLASYGGGPAEQGPGPSIWAPALRHMDGLRAGRAHVTEDATDTDSPSNRSYLTVPMRFSGELIGALSLAVEGAGGFDPEDVEIAREVADPLAVAIRQAGLHDELRAAHEELQRLTARIVEAQEGERRRIARELHDEVGQVLIGLKLNLEASARLDGEAAGARLRGAQVLVTDLIGRLRDLSLELRPPMLDDLGLLPALLWLFDRYTSHTRVHVTFRHAGLHGQRLSSDTETAAYRIVQEALTNVARHAHVDQAGVQLWTSEDLLHIRVRDQGAGFDAASAAALHLSSGLGGMRERAAVLGGRFAVESRRGAGTLVSAELPLGVRVSTEPESS